MCRGTCSYNLPLSCVQVLAAHAVYLAGVFHATHECVSVSVKHCHS